MTICCDLTRERQCVGLCMTGGAEVVFARDSRGGDFAAADHGKKLRDRYLPDRAAARRRYRILTLQELLEEAK